MLDIEEIARADTYKEVERYSRENRITAPYLFLRGESALENLEVDEAGMGSSLMNDRSDDVEVARNAEPCGSVHRNDLLPGHEQVRGEEEVDVAERDAQPRRLGLQVDGPVRHRRRPAEHRRPDASVFLLDVLCPVALVDAEVECERGVGKDAACSLVERMLDGGR